MPVSQCLGMDGHGLLVEGAVGVSDPAGLEDAVALCVHRDPV